MKPSVVTAIALLFFASTSPAAQAPQPKEKLEEEASHIISGTVVEIRSAVARSKVETAPGSHTDRTYTISVRVSKVAKGDGVAADETIAFTTWRIERRFPPIPGRQGQDDIPEKGDSVTVYLVRSADGEFTALLPNGIDIGG